MILAAGRGERMRPLTDTCPKPMLQAGGKPLIAWHLEALAQAGFNHVVINHAHLGELIERALGDGSQFGVRISYSAEGTALETAGGIRKALPLLATGHYSEPFLVLNGDVYTDWPIDHASKILETWSALNLEQKPLAHLVLVPNPEHNPKGDFYLTPTGTVHGDSEHAAEAATTSAAYTFSGIGIYQPELFKDLPLNEPAKLAPLLRQAMAKGRVTGELHPGLWLDIGTPARLNDLNEYLRNKAISNT